MFSEKDLTMLRQTPPAFFIATVLQAELAVVVPPLAVPLPSSGLAPPQLWVPHPFICILPQAYRPSIWLGMDYMSDGHTCTKWPLIFFKLTVLSKCKTLSPPLAA